MTENSLLGDLPPLGAVAQPSSGSKLGEDIEAMLDKYQADEEKATRIFKAADRDNSGSIDKKEMQNILKQLNVELSDSQFSAYSAKIFKDLDQDGSGAVELQEFLRFYKNVLSSEKKAARHRAKVESKFLSETQAQAARDKFFLVDVNNTGTIDQTELKQLMVSLDLSFPEDVFNKIVEETFAKIDRNHDGKVSVDEFIHFYKACLYSEEEIKKFKEQLAVRYKDESSNYLSGFSDS